MWGNRKEATCKARDQEKLGLSSGEGTNGGKIWQWDKRWVLGN
jgi:hypothetical protein